MPTNDGARIFGPGPGIKLGGKRFHLRYGFRALFHLEQQFGSLSKYLERLGQAEWGEDRLRAICIGLTAGLLHEKPKEQSVEEFTDFIIDSLPSERTELIVWIEVMAQAVGEQWPDNSSSRTLPKGPGSRKGSRGRKSTSRSRSRSAAHRKPSRR